MQEPANVEKPNRERLTRRLLWAGILLLALTAIVSSIGWFVSAREGRGLPPECYTLDTETSLRFDATHGNNNERATFAVSESDDEVMLGYWEESDDGPHTLEGYPARLTYTLIDPLGDRAVVDPAGDPIPRC